jgi:hypothetical protein
MKPPPIHQAVHLGLLAIVIFLIGFAAIQGFWILMAVGLLLMSYVIIGIWNSWKLWRAGVDPTAARRGMPLVERILSDLERPTPLSNLIGWAVLIAAILVFSIDDGFPDALIVLAPVLALAVLSLIALYLRSSR